MNQLRDAVCETITVGSGGRASGRERALLSGESHKRRGHILDILQSAGLGLRIIKEKVRGEGQFPHRFLFFHLFSLFFPPHFSPPLPFYVFVVVFFFFFLLFPRCSEPGGGFLPAGRRRRGAASAGGPRGGERGAGAPRAVGARRRAARAALMTNTLGRRGPPRRIPAAGAGATRRGSAGSGGARPGGTGGHAPTKKGRVEPSGSPSSRVPCCLHPAALPSLPPPFVFHHLPLFESPFPTSLPLTG